MDDKETQRTLRIVRAHFESKVGGLRTYSVGREMSPSRLFDADLPWNDHYEWSVKAWTGLTGLRVSERRKTRMSIGFPEGEWMPNPMFTKHVEGA